MQLNRQPVKRRRDLLEALSVTLFSPDDLVLVKGGPGERRGWLDDAAVGLDHQTDAVRSDVERILKQRNALLKQSRGRLDDAAALTLDVWDDRLTRAGEALAEPTGRHARRPRPPPHRGLPGPRRRRRCRSRPPTTRRGARPDWPPPSPRPATRTCGGGSRPSVPTGTRSGSGSTSLPGPHPRQPGRAAVPRPRHAARRAPGRSPSAAGRARSCCSTTCSPSSTTTAPRPSSRTCRRARRC